MWTRGALTGTVKMVKSEAYRQKWDKSFSILWILWEAFREQRWSCMAPIADRDAQKTNLRFCGHILWVSVTHSESVTHSLSQSNTLWVRNTHSESVTQSLFQWNTLESVTHSLSYWHSLWVSHTLWVSLTLSESIIHFLSQSNTLWFSQSVTHFLSQSHTLCVK